MILGLYAWIERQFESSKELTHQRSWMHERIFRGQNQGQKITRISKLDVSTKWNSTWNSCRINSLKSSHSRIKFWRLERILSSAISNSEERVIQIEVSGSTRAQKKGKAFMNIKSHGSHKARKNKIQAWRNCNCWY